MVQKVNARYVPWTQVRYFMKKSANIFMLQCCISPGACPTNGILIEFEIQPKFGALWFEILSTDHNKI